MTEEEWLSAPWIEGESTGLRVVLSSDLLQFLRDKASNRKLRLLACESLRTLIEKLRQCFKPDGIAHELPDKGSVWNAPIVAAHFADGLATAEELAKAESLARRDSNPNRFLDYAHQKTADQGAWNAADEVLQALSDFTGNSLDVADATNPLILEEWLEGGDLEHEVGLLRDIFGNPFRPATMEPAWITPTVKRLAETIYADRAFDRLPILADALEEVGCTNAEILVHCRGPGPHVRGCWVVDLLLGKE